MPTPQLLHFVVRNISYALTETGYLITCYTNNSCHLYLRWTSIVPAKHIIPRLVRGGQVGTYIDQCFVSYKDIEQNEAGDTFTHTFTCEPWPGCQTRWFYFWGTVASVLSPSASAIFYKHRLFEYKLYSDKGHGLTTCDGEVYTLGTALTWSEVRNGPAHFNELSAERWFCSLSASRTSNRWRTLHRTKHTFDLSSIPTYITIISVSYYFYVINKSCHWDDKPIYALVTAPAPPYNEIPLSDFNKFGFGIISHPLDYSQLTNAQFHHFDVSDTCLDLFKPGQKVAIGVRELKYDADNNPPPWYSGFGMYIQVASVDQTIAAWRPYLLIRGTK